MPLWKVTIEKMEQCLHNVGRRRALTANRMSRSTGSRPRRPSQLRIGGTSCLIVARPIVASRSGDSLAVKTPSLPESGKPRSDASSLQRPNAIGMLRPNLKAGVGTRLLDEIRSVGRIGLLIGDLGRRRAGAEHGVQSKRA